MIAVIVPAGAGGRPLVRTADSIARQSMPASIGLAVTGSEGDWPPLVRSVATRLHADVHHGANAPAAIVAAVARTSSAWFVVVPAGLRLARQFLARCAAAFEDRSDLAAIVPAVRLHSADGQAADTWQVSTTALAEVLADPRRTPPVIALRRSTWHRLGGLDEGLPGLAEYDFWIRLCALSEPIARLDALVVSCDVSQEGVWPAPAADADHLCAVRAVYRKHRALLEREMEAVLVGREVGFVRLRDAHRDLVRRRDADLAELDALRADAAHHRAYVQHHRQAAVDWGDLRRADPISREWGYDRGTPIDRRYIEQFVAAHCSDVRGSVLEVQEDDLTRRFGGPRVVGSDVLDLDTANTRATVHADLRCATELASNRYDCIILTQTLHVIDDTAAVLAECVRVLKPGGVLLATVPAASRVCLEYGEEGDLWRMTRAGALAMFEKAFGPGAVEATAFGNVLTTVAFLHGLACAELTDAEFDMHDPYYPSLIGVRARKSTDGPVADVSVVSGFSRTDDAVVSSVRRTGDSVLSRVSRTGRPGVRGAVLLHHRVDDRPDAYAMNVPVAVFEREMAWLKDECHVLPLDEILSTPPDRLPERAIALTFDDGYSDNLTAAVPVLQRLGLPATFFITTRWLERPGEYWWDLLERALLDTVSVPEELAIHTNGHQERWATKTRDERREVHRRLHERMVHASLRQRDDLAGALEAWAAAGLPRYQPMNAEQVCALARLSGVTIGAHTVNHLSLRDQPHDVWRDELATCRADLERLLTRKIDLVAYPYGAAGGAVVERIRMEWKWGLACDDLPVGDAFDAARVPRIDVGGIADVDQFFARLEQLFAPAG